MIKTLRYVLVLFLLPAVLLAAVSPAAADRYRTAVFTTGGSTAMVNGRPLYVEPPPYLVDGTVVVPVRALAAAMGAQVAWDPASRTVTLTGPGAVVVLTVASPVASVNGRAVAFGIAPRIVPPGITVGPAGWVAEAFGYTVHRLPALNWLLITNHPPVTFCTPGAAPPA